MSGAVGVCFGFGVGFFPPLSGAAVAALPTEAWSEQFLGSAVRFDNRKPTGFSKEDGLRGPEGRTPGDLS